ncbi:unnamed protein product [Clonostachys rosea]|uniref:Uncharacterized protein n=1 Tax=Bionectria ochroleuca TaxID=29856 RepID=A0ABY6UJJ0_BIOOC|nr:unnamed protein product [Clonostachys rosea]
MPSPGARMSPCNARVNHGSSSPADASEGSLLIDAALLGYGSGDYYYDDFEYDAEGYDSDEDSYDSDDSWCYADSAFSSEATDEEYMGGGEPYQGTFLATVVPYLQSLTNANEMEEIGFSIPESSTFEVVIVDDEGGDNDHLETLDLAVFVSEESLMDEPVNLDTTEYWASYDSGDLGSDGDESCISRNDFANILSEQDFVSVDRDDDDIISCNSFTSDNDTPMATFYGAGEDGVEYADVPICVDSPTAGSEKSGGNVLKRKLEIKSDDEGKRAKQKSVSFVESD